MPFFFLIHEVDGKDDIYWLLKISCFQLSGGGKYGLFLSQEVDGKMIFTGYWKVLVLKLFVMGNTIFFSAKKLVERWHLLSLFYLSMIFEDLGNTVFLAVNICLLAIFLSFCLWIFYAFIFYASLHGHIKVMRSCFSFMIELFLFQFYYSWC